MFLKKNPVPEDLARGFFGSLRLSGRQGLSPVPAPLRTVRATFTAHGSSKPGWSYCSRFPVKCPPDFGLLLSYSARRNWHCASVSDSSLLIPFSGSVHLLHVSTLSRRAILRPYPAGYVFPLPFGGWPSLLAASYAHGGFLRSGYCDSLSADLIGVSLFRISEVRPGWVPTIPRSLWCIHSGL